MILGRVIGQVWAARRDPRLQRQKLLVVRPHAIYEPAFATRHLVATDDVDAGVGDDVVICLGAPARASAGSNDMPVDAAVLGVVDRIELNADLLPAPGAAPGIKRPLDVLREAAAK
jgi:ethanolamine utilization protein EutN